MMLAHGVLELLLLYLTVTDYQHHDQNHPTHRYDLAGIYRWVGAAKSGAHDAIELA
jgi:hypothetical protein